MGKLNTIVSDMWADMRDKSARQKLYMENHYKPNLEKFPMVVEALRGDIRTNSYKSLADYNAHLWKDEGKWRFGFYGSMMSLEWWLVLNKRTQRKVIAIDREIKVLQEKRRNIILRNQKKFKPLTYQLAKKYLEMNAEELRKVELPDKNISEIMRVH